MVPDSVDLAQCPVKSPFIMRDRNVPSTGKDGSVRTPATDVHARSSPPELRAALGMRKQASLANGDARGDMAFYNPTRADMCDSGDCKGEECKKIHRSLGPFRSFAQMERAFKRD